MTERSAAPVREPPKTIFRPNEPSEAAASVRCLHLQAIARRRQVRLFRFVKTPAGNAPRGGYTQARSVNTQPRASLAMNRSLLSYSLFASLSFACILIGCTKQDAAVDDPEKHAIKPSPKPKVDSVAEPAAKPKTTPPPPSATGTATSTANARPSGTAGRPPFGINTSDAPRDPNSVFLKPAADFLTTLKARGYVLNPTKLPERIPDEQGYEVQGTSVLLGITELNGSPRTVGYIQLIVPAAELRKAESPTATLVMSVIEIVAGASRDEADVKRRFALWEHDAEGKIVGHVIGARSNPVMMHYIRQPNDALSLAFSMAAMQSELLPVVAPIPKRRANVNKSVPASVPQN